MSDPKQYIAVQFADKLSWFALVNGELLETSVVGHDDGRPDWGFAGVCDPIRGDDPVLQRAIRTVLEHMRDDANDRFSRVASEAQDAFWNVVVERYPEANTGDLDPLAVFAFNQACETVLKAWLAANEPGPAGIPRKVQIEALEVGMRLDQGVFDGLTDGPNDQTWTVRLFDGTSYVETRSTPERAVMVNVWSGNERQA